MDYRDRIRITPGKRSGQPCVRDLRITVGDVLGWLASGMSFDDVLADYPELTLEDVRACLAFAADRERGTMIVPPAA
ncbi:MAG: DUF433 domain-containing protein [Planctomycetes bacterium]|jgi:uncharacterized protein (DUF433 family)|nr:DUF433 domain-containing protein [Planctomycetota bacterium]MBZ0151738.1 DUF433 domain-containing protein [Planctomycetota bacterium]MCC7398315.1 DUF433 domain-containing protein [Planctomycetota bacterium]